jgi:hypothetical protein
MTKPLTEAGQGFVDDSQAVVTQPIFFIRGSPGAIDARQVNRFARPT